MTRAKETSRHIVNDIEILRERIRALEKKRTHENQCLKIIEHVSDIITIIDKAGSILSITPSFERALGHSYQKAIGKNICDYLHPDDAAIIQYEIDNPATGPGERKKHILRVKHDDGSYRSFETLSANYLHDPAIGGVVSSSRDITDRLETERCLKEERDRAQSYLDIVGVIIVAADREGIITLINKKGCDILGYNECNIIGKSCFDLLLTENDRIPARDVYLHMIEEGVGDYEYYESAIVTASGAERYISWHNAIIKSNDGFVRGILSSGEDITERMLAVKNLRDSEESYRLMFEDNPYPMWVYEYGTLKFLEVNRAAIDHYGYTRDEFLSMTIKDIRPAEEIPRLLENLAETKAGIDYAGVWRHTGKDGSLILAEITSHPITFRGKKAELVLSQDVTLQYEVQESLRLSEEKYHSLFNSMSEGVVIVQPIYGADSSIVDFEVLDINPVFTILFGTEKKDVVGKQGSTFVKLQSMSFYLECMSKVLATERPYSFEVVYKEIGKTVFASLFPVIGDILAAVFQDITDRKNALEEIKRNEEKLGILLRNERLISDIASRLNTSIDFNETMREIVNRIKEVAGIDYICMFKTGDNDALNGYFPSIILFDCPEKEDPVTSCPFRLQSIITALKNTDEYISIDLKELKPSERKRLADIGVKTFIAVPVRVAGTLRGVMCFGRNSVSVWCEEERDLLGTAVEIIANAIERDYNVRARIDAEKKQTLAVQMAERASRLASLGTMAAGIAHEINQPLNALMFTVDGMRYWKKRNHEIKSEELDENLEFISDQISRITEIIGTMRAMVRQDDRSKPSPVSINQTVEEVASLIRQQMMTHDIDTVFSLDSTVPDIIVNQSRLRQVVTNLMVNAFQALDGYSKPNKSIMVETMVSGGMIILRVTDNGPGIDDIIMPNLFDPFFTTKSSSDSMGLGLFITHSIITELGGIITAENAPDGGARFTISIPVPGTAEKHDEHCTC